MTALADFDDLVDAMREAAEITPEAFARLPAPWLSNGFYTVSLPDGSHRTFRVRLERSGVFAGRRTLALLIGPDNTSDYETQATVGAERFEFFKRFRGDRTVRHAEVLWHAAKTGTAPAGYEVLVSKRCRLCNRPLTDDESIRCEMGPICRERMGM